MQRGGFDPVLCVIVSCVANAIVRRRKRRRSTRRCSVLFKAARM